MKKKIEYTDEPMGKTRPVKDFLPPPEELVFKEVTDDGEDFTIEISHNSINFFKNLAKKHNTQYQKIIRNLLEEYVARHNK